MALYKWIQWLYFHGLGGSATMEYSFFGCSAYKQHKAISTTIDLEQGLNLLKDKNKLEVTNVRDLEDEY